MSVEQTISPPGFKMFLWPIWDITKISVRTINLRVDMSLPSKEGLTIASQMSVLCSIDPERAPDVLREFGTGYERGFILPIFRSAVADITAQFAAKDMHSGKRAKIEDRIKDTMNKRIKGRGFRIDAVLIKSIQLPPGLSKSIEDRLRAEQAAQRMVYVLQRERREAEHKLVEAEGNRDANRKLAEGLTPAVLRYKAIEALHELARPPNAELIITSDENPFGLGPVSALPDVPSPGVLVPPRRSRSRGGAPADSALATSRGSIGRAKKKPCASAQPSARRTAACAAVSTPTTSSRA